MEKDMALDNGQNEAAAKFEKIITNGCRTQEERMGQETLEQFAATLPNDLAQYM